MPSQHAGKQKSFRVSADEEALLERLAAREGGIKPAIMAGLRLLDGANDIDVAAVLERVAADIRRGARNPLLDVPIKEAAPGPHRAEITTHLPPVSVADRKAEGREKAAARFGKKAAKPAE